MYRTHSLRLSENALFETVTRDPAYPVRKAMKNQEPTQ